MSASAASPVAARRRTLTRAIALSAALFACTTLPVAERVAPFGDVLAASDGAGRPATLLVVSISGLTPDRTLEREPMPALASLAEAGVVAECVAPVAPAAAYPAHATFVTGLAPAEHGIVADQLLGERGVRRAQPRHASQLRTPTLWQRVREAGGAVAAFDWPTTTGAEIASLLPDVAAERSGERWEGLVAGGATPWVAARIQGAPAGVSEPGPERDAWLVDLACAALEQSPRLVLLRLRGAEAPLAAHGPRAPEVAVAFARVDEELVRLVRCAGQGGHLAQTAFVVLGDRALQASHTALLPNVWLAGEGLITAQGRWKAFARSNGSSAFVYAGDARTALQARQRLEEAAHETGAFRVVSAEEMIARHADPDAWFGLEAEPGFVFEDGIRGVPVAPSLRQGAGGQLRERPEGCTGFAAFGRGVRRGLVVPRMTQLDVAPTLAALLGVKLEPTAGRALVGLLRVGAPGG